jgi:hypothetical protein
MNFLPVKIQSFSRGWVGWGGSTTKGEGEGVLQLIFLWRGDSNLVILTKSSDERGVRPPEQPL